ADLTLEDSLVDLVKAIDLKNPDLAMKILELRDKQIEAGQKKMEFETAQKKMEFEAKKMEFEAKKMEFEAHKIEIEARQKETDMKEKAKQFLAELAMEMHKNGLKDIWITIDPIIKKAESSQLPTGVTAASIAEACKVDIRLFCSMFDDQLATGIKKCLFVEDSVVDIRRNFTVESTSFTTIDLAVNYIDLEDVAQGTSEDKRFCVQFLPDSNLNTDDQTLLSKLVHADEDGLAEKDLLERFRDDPVLHQDARNIIIRLIEVVEIVSSETRVLALVFPVVKPVPLDGLTQAQLARIRASLLNAVDFLHENGFAHHDIKPANLGMVADSPSEPTASGSLVLLDLGLMDYYPDPSRGSAGYRGTEEYLPQGYTRTSWRGWHPFELDDYAVKVTLQATDTVTRNSRPERFGCTGELANSAFSTACAISTFSATSHGRWWVQDAADTTDVVVRRLPPPTPHKDDNGMSRAYRSLYSHEFSDCLLLPLSLTDELHGLKNLFYLGAFQQVVNDATNPAIQPRSEAARIERRVYLARAQIAQGRPEAAVASATTGPASSSPEVRAALCLARHAAAARAADSTAARAAALADARALAPADAAAASPLTAVLVASVFCREDLHEDALRVLHPFPKHLECAALTVQVYLKMNRADLARKEVATIKTWADDATLAQLVEAWVNLFSGEEKVQDAFYTFDELSSSGTAAASAAPRLLVGKAVARMHAGSFAEAEELLLEALNRDSSDPEALANMVACSRAAGKPAEVVDRFF
ncbi:hypothetical protein HK405_006343, partial [Cladochytrium tenue]